MEFNKKLQELRKQKGLTQEDVAASLFVSRTAVSKWESGRGYPNIDSLKALAALFSVTVDELLSSNELLTIVEEDTSQQQSRTRCLVFGLFDLSSALFFFLPFFGQTTNGAVQAVSLLSLTQVAVYLKIIYLVITTFGVIFGLITLALQACKTPFWTKYNGILSLSFTTIASLLFVISSQPYAATLLLVFLAVKLLLLRSVSRP